MLNANVKAFMELHQMKFVVVFDAENKVNQQNCDSHNDAMHLH
jgi:hypothetical protein